MTTPDRVGEGSAVGIYARRSIEGVGGVHSVEGGFFFNRVAYFAHHLGLIGDAWQRMSTNTAERNIVLPCDAMTTTNTVDTLCACASLLSYGVVVTFNHNRM